MGLLADKLLYRKNWGSTGEHRLNSYNHMLLADISKRVYPSRIVSLDDATAAFAYEYSMELTPKHLLEILGYCRLPTERMWFEFNRESFLPQTPPGQTGFFLEKTSEDGFSIIIVDLETRATGPVITPSLFKFHFSTNPDEIQRFDNPLRLSFRQKTFYGLGMVYEPLAGDLRDTITNALSDESHRELIEEERAWRQIALHFEFDALIAGGSSGILKDARLRQTIVDMAEEYLQELAGTIRHVLAILSLYHFPPVEHYVRKPQPGRRIVNGQTKPYLGFEEMNIKWPKRKPVNPYKWVSKGLATTGIAKRRHEVDGHWRAYRKLTEAELDALGRPRELLEPHEFYKYTWVKSHERGDARIGYVRKRRVITV